MKKMLIGLCAATVCAVTAAAADHRQPITITGCVAKGEAPGSYVLMNVRTPTGPTDTIYWLTSTKGLKARVGHEVEITGTVSPSDNVAKIKAKTDPSKSPNTEVEIKEGGNSAKAKIETPAGTSGEKEKAELHKPVEKLHVSSVRAIGNNCQQ